MRIFSYNWYRIISGTAMRILLGLFFLIIAPQIFAGPFDPPPTDESVAILGTIFGNAVGDIYLGGVSNPVLYQMIEKLNFIIIAVGAVVISYVAVTSVIHTSHEGTILGKSWSALWIPLRSIIGMSMLVPTPTTGYSLIQVSVMWLILQGIGIADELWTITMNGLANGVSAAVGTITDPKILPTGKAIAPLLLEAELCMQSVIALANPNGDSFVYQHGTEIQSFDEIQNTVTTTGSKPYYFGIDNDGAYASVKGIKYFGFRNTNYPQPDAKVVCGSVNVSATVRLKEYPKPIQDLYPIVPSQPPTALENFLAQEAMLIYNTKISAFDAMLGLFKPIAQGYVNGTYAPANHPTSFKPQAPPGAVLNAAQAYAAKMSGLVIPSGAANISITSTAPTQPTQQTSGIGQFIQGSSITDVSLETKTIIDQGNTAGWISAGSFYFILNKTLLATQFASAAEAFNPADFNIPLCNNPNSSCLQGIAQYDLGTPENAPILNANIDPGVDRNFIAQNLADGYFYAQQELGAASQIGGLGTPGKSSLNMFLDWDGLNSTVASAMTTIFDGGTANVDPLLAHAKLGRIIMMSVEGIVMTVIALRILFGFLAWLPSPGIGSVATLSIVMGVLLLMFPVLGMLWSFGALLAIYCPLIPFMIFGVGALGWFLTVVEAMVSAPIISIGLLLPAGEELGRAEGAIMILANLFFRPALMILGFLFAGKVYKAFVTIVDVGMGSIFETIAVDTLFSIVIVVVIYTSFILSATNICFSLIYALPDRVLRWIGGKEEHTNAGALEEVKGFVEAAGEQVGSGLSDVGKKNLGKAQQLLSKAAFKKSTGGNNPPGRGQ